MANKNYYELLGLDKSATKAQIKKAFKKLAMKYHPDRAPQNKKAEYEEKFKEINEAVSVLSDEKKRQQYDQFGTTNFGQAGGAGGFQGFDFSDIMSQFRFGNFGDFDNVFEQVFGGSAGRSRGRRVYRGSDLLSELKITLEEAATGTSKTIQLNKLEHCKTCSGKGGTNIDSCSTCTGSGYTNVTKRTPFGIFQQRRPCHDCHGEGERVTDPCNNCDGEGLVRMKKKIDVKIPAGIDSGMRLRLSGEGEAGKNAGPSGDLYVRIIVKEHKHFRRIDSNLHITVPISFSQAVFGDEIEVPIIASKDKSVSKPRAILKIPKATDSETIFRMRGKGMPHLRASGHGDQFVKIKIEVPKKISKKQKEALEIFKDNPSKGFFERVFGK